jgi:hypothetical protein
MEEPTLDVPVLCVASGLDSFGDKVVGRGEAAGGAFEEREVEKPVGPLEFPPGLHKSVIKVFEHLTRRVELSRPEIESS